MTIFLRFAFIGVFNTGLHFVLLVFFVEKFNIWPPLGNAAAFMGANTFSFFANSRFSFRTDISSRRYVRFLATSVIGVAIAYGLSSVVENFGGHYLLSFFLLIILMPPVNYLLVRRFVFQDVDAAKNG